MIKKHRTWAARCKTKENGIRNYLRTQFIFEEAKQEKVIDAFLNSIPVTFRPGTKHFKRYNYISNRFKEFRKFLQSGTISID